MARHASDPNESQNRPEERVDVDPSIETKDEKRGLASVWNGCLSSVQNWYEDLTFGVTSSFTKQPATKAYQSFNSFQLREPSQDLKKGGER